MQNSGTPRELLLRLLIVGTDTFGRRDVNRVPAFRGLTGDRRIRGSRCKPGSSTPHIPAARAHPR